jgi:hypothetical protein
LLERRSEAFLRLMGERATQRLVASYVHVVGLDSVVQGASSMVLTVIAAQPGKSTRYVNNSLLRVARVMRQSGFDGCCVCTDGDSTCAANGQQALAHVRDREL